VASLRYAAGIAGALVVLGIGKYLGRRTTS
jgi:hypothetical protein